MQTYLLPECKLWNVIATYAYPSPTGTRQHDLITTPQPLTWQAARRELQRTLQHPRAVDAILIPTGPARPWSEETLTAYLRVLRGPKPATQLLAELRAETAASREYLLGALTRINTQALQPAATGTD